MYVLLADVRVDQAEYVIRILAAASQEYVNTYSTRRAPTKESNLDAYSTHSCSHEWNPRIEKCMECPYQSK